MKCTSAEAGKMLRKLMEEKSSIEMRECKGKEFLAAVGEDLESVRPDYDFAKTQSALAEVEEKIRKLKHALNVFNSTTVIPEFDMTIDEMLVYIPQLTARKNKLSSMKDKLPKIREQSRTNSSILDYRYLNYDVAEVAAEYEKAADTLAKAQNALDAVVRAVDLCDAVCVECSADAAVGAGIDDRGRSAGLADDQSALQSFRHNKLPPYAY